MKSERFACITMLCSFQKTQKEITGRENSKIKWYWNLTGSVSIFFSYFINCKQNADKSHSDRAQKYNAT